MCERTAKLYSEPRLLALTPPGRHKAAHDDVMDTTREPTHNYEDSDPKRLQAESRLQAINMPVFQKKPDRETCRGSLFSRLLCQMHRHASSSPHPLLARGSNAPTPDILCVRPLTDYYYNIFLPSKRRFFPASTWRLRALPPLNCLCSRRRVAPRCRCLTSAFSNRLYSLRRCRWPRCWLLVAEPGHRGNVPTTH